MDDPEKKNTHDGILDVKKYIQTVNSSCSDHDGLDVLLCLPIVIATLQAV